MAYPQKGKRQSQKSSLVPTFLYSCLFHFFYLYLSFFFFPGITSVFRAEWQIIQSNFLTFWMRTWKFNEMWLTQSCHQLESKSASERWLLAPSPAQVLAPFNSTALHHFAKPSPTTDLRGKTTSSGNSQKHWVAYVAVESLKILRPLTPIFFALWGSLENDPLSSACLLSQIQVDQEITFRVVCDSSRALSKRKIKIQTLNIYNFYSNRFSEDR